jgi:hypothetical protein
MTAAAGDPPRRPGPWFRAQARLECSECLRRICEGQAARADMDGGFLCLGCGQRYGGLADVPVTGGLL